MGHADPRLTLQVYAQVIQRQRVDHELVWQLMRFGDEVERWPGARRRTSDPTIDPLPLAREVARYSSQRLRVEQLEPRGLLDALERAREQQVDPARSSSASRRCARGSRPRSWKRHGGILIYVGRVERRA